MEYLKREVPGYDGQYVIEINAEDAMCYSVKSGKYLSNRINRDGRVYWNLCKNGCAKNWQAARWVAFTFPEIVVGEYFDGAEIDHIDTDRLNNHPSNLRWVNSIGNNRNPLTRKHKSEANKGHKISEDTKKKISQSLKGNKLTIEAKEKISKAKSKCVIKLSRNNEILHFYSSAREAEKETGVDASNICLCCKNKQKTAGGFLWKYAE